ncbi:hypothetical protein [Effusibacillus consociatus]|uniref:Uncharacterized protein n=1 Tax=Effusibacillus consociatus TaxID=1117041 RepID=A0ABV9Q4I2_9BACL
MRGLNFQLWQVTNQHLGDNGQTVAIELHDPDGWFDANVRWDGCMEIHLHSKTEEGTKLTDTIHTCDIDGLIEKLRDLKQISQEYFDYEGYWKQEDQEDTI